MQPLYEAAGTVAGAAHRHTAGASQLHNAACEREGEGLMVV
jgi:hypothetical protein